METTINATNFAELICESFQKWTGRPLLPSGVAQLPVEKALFTWNHVVLAHTAEEIPRFCYANHAAESLFQMTQETIIGLPSHQSAEAPERSERERLLTTVAKQGFIDDYSGIRVNSEGVRFRIEKATVWNLVDRDGNLRGQAATFGEWRYLSG